MNASLLELLQIMRAPGSVSGARLAVMQGCSRTAIWKQVQQLRACGIAITAAPGQGYTLEQAPDLLDAGEIMSRLDQPAAQVLQRLTCLPACASTNQLLEEMPEPGTAAVLAEYQSSGRGRRGNSWLAPACGSLLMSLRWQFNTGLAELSLLGMQTGLLLRELLQALTSAPVGLKWPNDIIAGDAKLAGILIELQGGMDGPCTVIIGIGINVSWPRAWLHETGERLQAADADSLIPVDLASLGACVGRNELAAAILNRLVSLCMAQENTAQENTTQENNSAPTAAGVMAAWRRHDILYGQPVKIMADGETRHGRAAGIDASGAYVVDIQGRSVRFSSSSVSIRACNKIARIFHEGEQPS